MTSRVLFAAHRIAIAQLSVLVALAAGCAVTPRIDRDVPIRVSIQAGKASEACFPLAAGERVVYAFQATMPVDFNLHTHRGRDVVTPVDVKQTSTQTGTYVSLQDGDYCLMWMNAGGVPAHISGEWRRVGK